MNPSSLTIPEVTEQTVFVCGSLHLDVVVDSPHLPQLDETVVGSKVNYVCGGKGGNQAVAAALNGAVTAFAGCIGDDEFGEKLNTHLVSHSVECTGLQRISGASGMSVAIVDANGDYGAVIVSASNQNIDTATIEFPDSAGILLLQNEIPEHANLELAQHASKHNIPVMLNAAPYRTLSMQLEGLIDLLVLNRVEAEQFFGQQLQTNDEVATVLDKAKPSIPTIIVTLGEDGLVYRDSKGQVHRKTAYPVAVQSSHGAGDMFCGALASRILKGELSSQALDYAMAAAACHVSTPLDMRSKLNTEAIQLLLSD